MMEVASATRSVEAGVDEAVVDEVLVGVVVDPVVGPVVGSVELVRVGTEVDVSELVLRLAELEVSDVVLGVIVVLLALAVPRGSGCVTRSNEKQPVGGCPPRLTSSGCDTGLSVQT